MSKISIVDSIMIKNEKRLDAEYYKPEFLDVLNVLSKLKCLKMREVSNSIRKGIFYILANEYKLRGIPFLRVSNLGNPFVETKELVFISEEKNKEHKKTELTVGDIAISKGGSLGYIGVITPDIEKCNICQDIIGVKIKKEKINPYFLAIFLLSKYGQVQLERGRSQQVQPHLTLDVVRNLIIPEFSNDFQLQIEYLVKHAYEKRKLSEQKYEQAERSLYKLLGMSEEDVGKLEEEKSYETDFKNVSESLRLDAEYYHPKYLGIIKLLEKSPFEIKSLKEVVEISNEKINPTNEENKTKRFRYVPIAKINESGEIFEWDEFYGWQAPSRARMLIKENDIVIPSLAGTFDKIALVPRELDEQLTTTGCFVVRVKEDYPEFLFLLLRTPLFKRQLEQQTTGAIMSAVPKSLFGNLLIPKIPKEYQKGIATLVREYFELRKEARGLIKQAIKKVEEEIENASDTRSIREQ